MNKYTLILVLLLLSAVIILSGCIDSVPAKEPSRFTLLYKETPEGMWNTIEVSHDNELNVTCYSAGIMQRGGISCIPDSQLK